LRIDDGLDINHVAAGDESRAVDEIGNRRIFDPQTQETSIAYRLDAEGTQRLAQAKEQNIGKHLAIVFDEQVMSSPVIDAAITGGEGRISA
ncbi:hypothetical protein ACCS64_38140, partial [Rhizobium ruizarguesonis]